MYVFENRMVVNFFFEPDYILGYTNFIFEILYFFVLVQSRPMILFSIFFFSKHFTFKYTL